MTRLAAGLTHQLIGLESDQPPPPGRGRTVIQDTQDLYTGYIGKRPKGGQVRLEIACRDMGFVRLLRCCDARSIEIQTDTLHNAGNDAAYTLALAEQLLTPSRLTIPPTPEVDIDLYESMNWNARRPVQDDDEDDYLAQGMY